MTERRLFFSLLSVMRRKLWMRWAVSLFYMILLAVACAVAVWIVCARFLVIPYLNEKILITCGLGLLAWILAVLYRQPSWKEAARAFDSYSLDDRVLTMLTFLDDDSEIARLQRKDTLVSMREALNKVKASRIQWLYWKRAVPVVVLALVVVVAMAYPNGVMEKAAQAEKEHHIVAEKKNDLKQFVAKQRDKVKPQAEKKLKALKKDVAKEKKAEDVMKQMLEANKQLQKLKEQAAGSEQKLQRAQQSLQGKGLPGLSQALQQRNPATLRSAMQDLREQLGEMSASEKKKLMAKLRDAAAAAGQGGKLAGSPEESLAALRKQLAKMMEEAGGAQGLAGAQRQLQHLAKGLNREMAAAGLARRGALAFGGSDGPMPAGSGLASGSKSGAKNGGSGTGGKSGSSSGAGDGSGNGSGSGSGSGSGNGSGPGSGSGSGSGAGSGTGGSGSGAGGGNGAGFGEGSHNLLTVPKKLNAKQNKEIDSGPTGKGKGTKQLAQQSPVLPGKVRPYQKVYGDYQSTYRQSVDRMNLPDHLQTIVKDYFSDLAPK